MAFLRKYIDKATFMLISGAWAAVSTAIMTVTNEHPVITVLVVTIGTLVVAWIGVETQAAPAEATA